MKREMFFSFLALIYSTITLCAAPPATAPTGMLWVAPGQFTMGSNDPHDNPNERPAHVVKLDGFWMVEHDVTNAEFQIKVFAQSLGHIRDLGAGSTPMPDITNISIQDGDLPLLHLL